MAYEIPNFYVGVFPADTDLSASSNQFTGVGVYTAVSTTGTGVGGAAIAAFASLSSPIIGVLQNNPQQGEAGTVMVQGVTKAVAGGAFNPGDMLMCTTGGKFVKATTGNFAVAVALEVAANGDITTILLQRNGKQ